MQDIALNHSPFAIVGMHRSGTSLTAALLQSAGIDVGRKLLGPSQGNVKGHYENLDFLDFHRTVLTSQGINEAGWTLVEDIHVEERYTAQAIEIVERNSLSSLWGWKDPRTTLFLDFWAHLLPNSRFLLIYRYPWEVIDSLYRRGGVADSIFFEHPDLAAKLWIHYNRKILSFVSRFPSRCLLVSLYDVVSQTKDFVEAINEKFKVSLASPQPNIYEKSLLHSSNSIDQNSNRASLIAHCFPEAIEICQELDSKAIQLNEVSPISSWSAQIQISPFRALVFQNWANTWVIQKEHKKISEEHQQAHSRLHETQAELERSQAQLHNTHAQWEQSQAQLQQTQAELERSQAQLHNTHAQWEQSQAQLQQTQAELARSQAQLQQTQVELERSQAQLQQTQAELEQSQAQQTTDDELEQSQAQFHEVQVELVRSQAQIRDAEAERQQAQAHIQELEVAIEQLQVQLQQTYGRLEYSQTVITAMQTSKFWKLRTKWMNFKKALQVEPPEEFKSAIENLPGLNLNSTTQPSRKGVVPLELERYKQTVTTTYKNVLNSFLASGANLELPTNSTPLVTVVLVLYNRAELTFQCLRSLSENFYNSFEVVIVDNASSDETSLLLDRIQGARIIRNSENYHFLLASNQAAKIAKGKYILFLNNDAQVLPGSIASAVKTIESADDIGAVGGKILLLDGSLQEAGSIIWQDGSCLGYGRGDSPFAPEYMFARDVDYCSGAFLLTSRELFSQMGGFDEDYKPAYYEEADYCLRLWRSGKRVVYDPDVVILHFEFASSKSSDAALQLQAKNREVFINNHREQLQTHQLPNPSNVLLARTPIRRQPRVLFIDDRVPHEFLGAGFPRARAILLSLLELGYFVTFYPLTTDTENWATVYLDTPKSVEVMTEHGKAKLAEFLQQRANYYEAIFISRPHNMEVLQEVLDKNPELFANTKLIYDAEAIFSLREIAYRRLNNQEVLTSEIDALIRNEMSLAKGASSIVSVSEVESKKFIEYGFSKVHTLGHMVPLRPTENSFGQRADILFVGAIHDDGSPNADSVIWFANQVFPQVQQQIGPSLKFKVVGFNSSEKVFDLANDHIQVMGRVNNLESYYNRARLFVVPTRFAAGIPLKIYEAASYGLPVVTTSLIAAQLGWQDGIELLIADTPSEFAQKCVQLYTDEELWEKLRFNISRKIEAEGSKEAFITKLKEILTKE